ncbi:MAG: hypothetical protein J5935_00125 [Lachnospiraceae bacterium]|nr:hypothetical protein [Lachnospiraceae bacterium]
MNRSARLLQHKLLLLCLVFLSLFALTACGKKQSKEEQAYLTELSVFFESLSHYDAQMASIDPAGENASEELLKTIDNMANDSARVASLEAPESYAEVASSAVKLSLEMQKAKDSYHKAFESEAFDENAYAEGNASYEKANAELQQMLTLLNPEAE